jgi:hypothetical protein
LEQVNSRIRRIAGLGLLVGAAGLLMGQTCDLGTLSLDQLSEDDQRQLVTQLLTEVTVNAADLEANVGTDEMRRAGNTAFQQMQVFTNAHSGPTASDNQQDVLGILFDAYLLASLNGPDGTPLYPGVQRQIAAIEQDASAALEPGGDALGKRVGLAIKVKEAANPGSAIATLSQPAAAPEPESEPPQCAGPQTLTECLGLDRSISPADVDACLALAAPLAGVDPEKASDVPKTVVNNPASGLLFVSCISAGREPASAASAPPAPPAPEERPPIRECAPELSLAECVTVNLGIKISAEDVDACLALAAPLADVDPDKANDFRQKIIFDNAISAAIFARCLASP